MIGRQTCVGCGRMSPETNGEITLTTSFGWRIRRNLQAAADGQTEWRCPACWQKYKAAQVPTSGEPAAPAAPTDKGRPPGKA